MTNYRPISLLLQFFKIFEKLLHSRRRVARIWKRGGFFERVRKVQTALTQIFIVLDSVTHGFSENQDEIFRKFKRFFRLKSGGLQKKKKKVFTEIETAFSAKIGNSNVFSAQNQVVSKKKKKKKGN